jgi:hypothetical protein
MTSPIQNRQDSVSCWTAQTLAMDWAILDRMERAAAKVRERLLKATAGLVAFILHPYRGASTSGAASASTSMGSDSGLFHQAGSTVFK